MLSLLIGILAATGASTLYSLGIGVQAIDARATSQRHTLRISLLGQLLRRGRWLAGTAMTALGWPLQIVALLFAPLEVVQPALAIGLLVLLALGERMLGERPGRRELTAVCAIIAGVVGIAALAPDRTTHHVHGVALVLVLALLGAAALVPFAAQFVGRSIANLTMIAAGLAFAWGALATKLVADAASGDHWLTAILWGAAAITASVVGLIAEMSALQQRAAILVAPVVFVAQTFVPVMLAPLILHESFLDSPLSGVPLVFCLLVLLAGATTLARSPALLARSGSRQRELVQRLRDEPQLGVVGSGTPDSRDSCSATTSLRTAREAPAETGSPTTTMSPAPGVRENAAPSGRN
jgi:drug/metabolite transporter (DMT)-like permease